MLYNMNILAKQQMSYVSGGTTRDAITCLGGVAGFAVFFATIPFHGPISAIAAVGFSAEFVSAGASVGLGCGSWLKSLMN